MAMTQFEKALISELQGIRKELSKMNTKEFIQTTVDALDIYKENLSTAVSAEIDMGALLNNSMRSGERATFHR